MESIYPALKSSGVESVNKLMMLDHLYEIDDPHLRNYIHGIKNAIVSGRKSGYKAGAKSIIGKNNSIQLENYFRHGGYCESLHLEESIAEKIYSNHEHDKKVEDFVFKFKRDNDIGHVYLIAGTYNGKTMFKIGKANDLNQRLRTFEVRIPFDIDLVFAIEVKNPSRVESQIHKVFKDNRVDGEWFDFNTDMVVICILTMYSIQSLNGGFSKEWQRHRQNQSKLDDDGYIEYLESILAFNGIKFDQNKRKDKKLG
jgi:hypothetical protein